MTVPMMTTSMTTTVPTTDIEGAATAPRILDRCRTLVRPALAEAIDGLHDWPAEMARYSLGWCEPGGAPAGGSGGKGLRQALAVLGAEAAGASGGTAVPAAVAVELVHTFSLLHDDIMDGDALRRGRPTVWKAYGTGPAVLGGDALFALAVQVLAAAPAAQAPAALSRLSTALTDLVRGQADDLLFQSRPWTGPDAVGVAEYEAMAEHKTGALLGCAAALGAQLGGGRQELITALDGAGRHLGVAFQIVDDVLGIWGDPCVTGKPVHGDLRQRKKTLPILAALATPNEALTALLTASGPVDAPRAAGLVEDSGGREIALAEARRHLAAVDDCLDGVEMAPRAVAELRTLLEFLTQRQL